MLQLVSSGPCCWLCASAASLSRPGSHSKPIDSSACPSQPSGISIGTEGRGVNVSLQSDNLVSQCSVTAEQVTLEQAAQSARHKCAKYTVHTDASSTVQVLDCICTCTSHGIHGLQGMRCTVALLGCSSYWLCLLTEPLTIFCMGCRWHGLICQRGLQRLKRHTAAFCALIKPIRRPLLAILCKIGSVAGHPRAPWSSI